MKTVLISGGTGLVGSVLTKKLRTAGHRVRILSRQKGEDHFYWNPEKNEIDASAFENLDAVIHLAGASIAKRWTASYKKELYSSRIDTSKLIFEQLKKSNTKIECFISASGVNYYGTETSRHIFTEEDPNSNDFLGKLCADWEAAAFDFEQLGARVCALRTAVVLSADGGMIKKLIPAAKFNMVSALGSGNQIVPWIHIDDLADIYKWLIENPNLSGAFNASATQIVNSREFTKAFVGAMGKKIILPNTPAFMLKLIFGETASIMLEGSAVSNKKIKDTGFRFQFDNLETAFKNLLDG